MKAIPTIRISPIFLSLLRMISVPHAPISDSFRRLRDCGTTLKQGKIESNSNDLPI